MSDRTDAFDRRRAPRISVVMPSLNQVEFLETAIASVVDQRYPNLEFMVLDGGSTDGSVEVIKGFESNIDYWRSHADTGQSSALKEGFAIATGDIFCWLNSDDVYEPGSFDNVARAWDLLGGGLLITGGCRRIGGWWDGETHYPTFQSAFNERVRLPVSEILDVPFRWMTGDFFFQPEVFFPADLYRAVGGINESIHYAMDYDLWVRMALAGAEVAVLDIPLAAYRVHSTQKTSDLEETVRETAQLANRYVASLNLYRAGTMRLAGRNRKAYELRLVAKAIRARRLLVTKVLGR